MEYLTNNFISGLNDDSETSGGKILSRVELFPGFVLLRSEVKKVSREFDIHSILGVAVLYIKTGHLMVNGTSLKAGAMCICSLHMVELIKAEEAEFIAVLLPACFINLEYLVGEPVVYCSADSNTSGCREMKMDMEELLAKSEHMGASERLASGRIFEENLGGFVNQVLGKEYQYYSFRTPLQRLFCYLNRVLYRNDFKLEELPSVLYMSRAKIYRVSENFGGVKALINSLRLSKAFIDIVNDDTGCSYMSEVARRYGFKTIRSFSRAFKKKHGINPSALGKMGMAGDALPPDELNTPDINNLFYSLFVVGDLK